MNNIRLISTLVLFFILQSSLKGQINGTPNPQNGVVRCVTSELAEHRREKHPELGSIEDFESWLQERMERHPVHLSREILTIPVVVHVIHDGEEIGSGRNIPYEQILSQIEVLNEDFRRQEGTLGFNEDSVGADIEIEFCLANIDNQGRLMVFEPGVNRIDRNEREWNGFPHGVGYIDDVVQPQTIWDPEKYFNIWVTEISGSILGFAVTPVQSTLPDLFGTSTPQNDGVVVNYRNFGRIGNLRSDFDLGRTLTHEVGHWLGLYHIWGPGSESSTCDIDDFCEDTPTTDESHYGCASNSFSCDSDDMVENYMDYSDDACMNIFTQDQRSRMRTVIFNSPRRRELLNSQVCVKPTVAPTAIFSTGELSSCDGRVQFFDESLDFPSEWYWTFGNGQISDAKNPTIKYDSTGFYEILLIAANPLGAGVLRDTIFVEVLSPGVQAGADIESCVGTQVQLDAGIFDSTATYLWTSSTGSDSFADFAPTVQVEDNKTFILSVSYENGCVVTDTVELKALPNPTTFALPIGSITIPAGSSTQLNAIGADTYVWSPSVGLSDPNIASPVASPDTTTMYVVNGFNTGGCSKPDSILVIVNRDVSVEAFLSAEQIFAPYPNPVKGYTTFSANFREAGTLKLALYDLRGKRLRNIYDGQVGQAKWTFEWQKSSNLPPGTYFVKWEMNGSRFVQKLLLE